jgi:hypothetical protein
MVEGSRFDFTRFYRMPVLDARFMPPVNITVRTSLLDGQVAEATSLKSMLQRSLAAQAGMQIEEATQETQSRIDRLNRTLNDDISSIEEANAQFKETNESLLPLLETLTGQKFGDDPEPWRKWWADQLGLAVDQSDKQRVESRYETVTEPDVQVQLPVVSIQVLTHSCFGAGTVAHTIRGPRRIESIQAGDRVLSQDTSTGALSFKSVLTPHRNGSAATFRIAFNDETIIATGIHRFWKAGAGWTMARDLKPGDRLRMLAGIASIKSIKPDATQMVYNLTIADNGTFLVGSAGLLVHDFSFVQPVSEPFDQSTKPLPVTSN